MREPVPGRWRWFGPWLVAAALLGFGAGRLWFLCDDAFIAFRYVGNAHDGHGLVWNPAPFRPVEGYSCFLWVVLLRCVWAVTGLPPPQTANPLAFGCALLSLALLARRLVALRLPESVRPAQPWLATLVLLAISGNHTVATWASSGLETALFGLCAVGWTLAASRGPLPWPRSALVPLSLWAALAALTRPDGGLLVLATLALALPLWRTPRQVFGLWPLLLPVLHLGWRRACYGEWLPNTYYAKVTAAWPESGLRYLGCFLFEHGGWLALPLLLGVGVPSLLRGAVWRAIFGTHWPVLVAVGTWGSFVGYYALVVGGDHFAYRPFAHLVPLAALAGFWLLAQRVPRPGLLALLVGGVALCSNLFGWCYEHNLRGREKDGFVRAAAVLPQPLARLCRPWERWQAWLRLRYVALPRPLHDVTCRDLLASLPERGPGHVEGLPAGVRGVYHTVAAGVVGWALADVAIVDTVGLNDWVVARSRAREPAANFDFAMLQALFPAADRDGDRRLGAAEIEALAQQFDFGALGVPVSPKAWADLLLALCDGDGDGLDAVEFAAAAAELGNRRHMAHERRPPPGYEAALRANVRFDGRRFAARADVAPLSDDEVRAVEQRFAAEVRR